MNARSAPSWLLRAAVALAVPTIACFGYYSLAYVDQEGSAWSTLVILAYPTALIGLVGVVAVLVSRRRSRALLWLAFVCLAVPLVFLLVLRM